MPARSLMLGEILKGVTPISWDIFNIRDFIRGVVPERFRVAPAVICLTRVAACGRLVPAKYLIVVFYMAVANFGIILGASDVMLDAEVLLSKLVDQASKGPKQTLFHTGSQRAKALGMSLILIINCRQTLIPLAQRLIFHVRNIAEVGFRHPRDSIRWRQHVQDHPGIFSDDTVQLAAEIGPQIGISGKQRLYRNGRAIAVHCAVLLGDDVLTVAAMAEEFPKIMLHGTSRLPAGSVVGLVG